MRAISPALISSRTLRAAVGQHVVGRVVGASGDDLCGHVRIAGRIAEDRRQRFGRRDHQRRGLPLQDATQRLVDRAGIASQGRVLAGDLTRATHAVLGAVAAPAHGIAEIARQAGHVDGVGRQVRGDLQQSDRADADRQHIGVMRKGHGAQQRLQVEAIGHLDRVHELVRQAKALDAPVGREDREAVGLHRPEFVVLDDRVDGGLDGSHAVLVGVRGLELRDRGLEEVLELDAVRLRVLRQRRGAQVEGDGRRAAVRGQALDFGPGRQVDVKQADLQECARRSGARGSNSSIGARPGTTRGRSGVKPSFPGNPRRAGSSIPTGSPLSAATRGLPP